MVVSVLASSSSLMHGRRHTGLSILALFQPEVHPGANAHVCCPRKSKAGIVFSWVLYIAVV